MLQRLSAIHELQIVGIISIRIIKISNQIDIMKQKRELLTE